MAVTAELVYVGHNILRYLLTQDGQAGTTATITTTGAASPDLLTDSLAGPIKQIAKTFTDGYKQFAAGVQTQAKARGLWLSDIANAGAGLQNTNPTARCDLDGRGVDGSANAAVDANVDGGGHPTIEITMGANAAVAYLDVRIPNAIGA